MPKRPSLLLAVLLAAVAGPGAGPSRAQGEAPPAPPADLPVQSEMDDKAVFPYELLNYTQAGHDHRVINADAIVVGRIESYLRNPEGEELLNFTVTLRPEAFLRTDRPRLDKQNKIRFRCLPLREPYRDMQAGDRCLVLLARDLRKDNALYLPTDMDYYPIDEEGQVQKFFKQVPTEAPPELMEVPLSQFLEELRGLLYRVSLEGQFASSELVLAGRVAESHQGKGDAEDYEYVRIAPERIFKGDPGQGDITIIQTINPLRHTIAALNAAAFREGERILVFANKDPTFSQQGAWNPGGAPLWVFPYQRHSSLFLAGGSAWRRGFRAVPENTLFEKLAAWAAAKPAEG